MKDKGISRREFLKGTGVLVAGVAASQYPVNILAAPKEILREAAMLMGIDTKKIYCVAFAIGAATTGAAGACFSTFIPTSQDVGMLFTLTSFVIVIAGGVGVYYGTLIAGFLIGIVEELGAVVLSGSMKQVVSFCLLMVILLYRPQGLFGREGD